MRGISIDNGPVEQTAALGNEKKKNKLRFLVPLAMILTVAAIACSGSSGSTSILGDETPSSVDLTPDFSINMFQGQNVVGGQDVSLHSLLGEKPMVLNFWAGLCPPCEAELTDLQEFNDEYHDQVLLVGVDLGQFFGLGNQQDAKNLLARKEITYPAGFTADPDVIRDYKVLGMPTTIFIDREGQIFNKWTGALNSSILEEKTLEMLAQ